MLACTAYMQSLQLGARQQANGEASWKLWRPDIGGQAELKGSEVIEVAQPMQLNRSQRTLQKQFKT